jgi:hypothetical protein
MVENEAGFVDQKTLIDGNSRSRPLNATENKYGYYNTLIPN